MRSTPGDAPFEEAALLTVRGAGVLVRVRVYGLTPASRMVRPIVIVLATNGDPDAAGTQTLCRRLGTAERVVVLHCCPTDAIADVHTVVEWIADHAEPLGGRRGEVQLGAVGEAAMTARQVMARIDRAGWPTVIRPLVTACPRAQAPNDPSLTGRSRRLRGPGLAAAEDSDRRRGHAEGTTYGSAGTWRAHRRPTQP